MIKQTESPEWTSLIALQDLLTHESTTFTGIGEIAEFLSNIKNIHLADESHIEDLPYNISYMNPYFFGKASMKVEDDKVIITSTIGDTDTGIDLVDDHFQALRVQNYGDRIHLLFDYYYTNGGYSNRCHTITIGARGKNTKCAIQIQKYRTLLYSQPKKAKEYLRSAKIIHHSLKAIHSYVSNTKQPFKKAGETFPRNWFANPSPLPRH